MLYATFEEFNPSTSEKWMKRMIIKCVHQFKMFSVAIKVRASRFSYNKFRGIYFQIWFIESNTAEIYMPKCMNS